MGNLNREFKLNCVLPTPAALKVMIKKYEKHSFELIFINQEAIQYSFEEFKVVMPLLIRLLHVRKGSVIINAMIPTLTRPTDDESWKFLLHMKAFVDVDIALGAFDSGVLVIRSRQNGYMLRDDAEEIDAVMQERHEMLHISPSDYFFHIADRFVPILDFLHLHKWLSLQYGTVKFTAIPWDKLCVLDPDENITNVGQRPDVICRRL